jgi:hypothetical protein
MASSSSSGDDIGVETSRRVRQLSFHQIGEISMKSCTVGIKVHDNLLVILKKCFTDLEPCFRYCPDQLGRLTTFDVARDVGALEEECYVSV